MSVIMENKEIRELSEEEVLRCNKLGTAFGSWGICWYQAHRRVPNFRERVYGYRITREEGAEMLQKALNEKGLDQGEIISVSFYEKMQ